MSGVYYGRTKGEGCGHVNSIRRIYVIFFGGAGGGLGGGGGGENVILAFCL